MFNSLKLFFAPMLSLFLIAIGASLQTTLQSVYLSRHHYSTTIVGLITAAYYIGFVYAAFKVERFIIRVAHIRAYATFAALFTSLAILQGIFPEPWVWVIARLIAGFCTAGLFVVIESWLLCKSSLEVRGQVLALYMFVYYAAQGLAQYFINLGVEQVILLFAIIGIFCSLSIVPVAMTKVDAPALTEPSTLKFKALYKLSPAGVIGSFVSGLLLGPIYGLTPLYLDKLPGNYHIAVGMSAVIFGGMLFQYPLGRLSDITDRRLILLITFVICLVVSGYLIAVHTPYTLWFTSLFIFGGMTFAIYPLSMSHACDVIRTDDLVAAAQGLVLANSVGMAIGPLISATLMNITTPGWGLFGYAACLSLAMTVFFVWRLIKGQRVATEDQSAFIALARTTPVAVEIDPRTDEGN